MQDSRRALTLAAVPRGGRGGRGGHGVWRGAAAGRFQHREGPQLLQPPRGLVLTAPPSAPPASSRCPCRRKCRRQPHRPGTGHRGTPGTRALCGAGHGAANGPRCAQQSTSRGAEEALAAGPAMAGTPRSPRLPAAGTGQCPALPDAATGPLRHPPGPGRGSESAEQVACTLPLLPRPPSPVHTPHHCSKGTWSNPPLPPPCYPLRLHPPEPSSAPDGPALGQVRGGSRFFNDNYILERIYQQLIVGLVQFV